MFHSSCSSRLPSIETYRVVAMFIVVAIHANFFAHLQVLNGGYGFIIDVPVALTWWLSVPYFFLVAGYFFGQRIRQGDEPYGLWAEYSRPLSRVFLFWLLLYFLIPRHWIVSFRERGVWETMTATAAQAWHVFVDDPLLVLINGWQPLGHLWFLPILVVGLSGIVLISKSRFEHRLPIILAGGYVITVLLAFLPPAWLRAHPPQWYLFGLLFTLFGWWLSRRPPVPQRTALFLIGLGLLLAAVEGLLTRLLLHGPVMQIYGGTVVISVGVFLFTLARPRLGEGTAFPMLARFTLGVYVSHILVEYTLAPLNDRLPHLSIVWHLAYVCLVYALSVFITWGFSRLPGLQWTVQKHATGMSWIPPIQTALSSGRR